MAGRDANLTGPQHQGGNDGYQVVTLPQSLAAASGAIATISGIVKIRNIVGTVTTVLATTTSLRVFIGATAITASTTITTLTTLTLLLRETAIASVLTAIATSIPSLHAHPTDLIAGTAGSLVTITASLDASGTGVISWGLEYTPLSPAARIVATQ
jgi:hypothetical protein